MAQAQDVARRDNGSGAVRSLRDQVRRSALDMLQGMLPPQKLQESAGRVGLAFETARRISKDKTAWDKCSKESVGACIVKCALLELYPGTNPPQVYLVPRGGEMSAEFTHVGWAELARRSGHGLMPVCVYRGDEVELVDGEAKNHRVPIEGRRETYEDLLGVYIVIRRLSDNEVIMRPWCSKATIDARKRSKQAGPVWNQWPIEMSMKTAIKWLAARGIMTGIVSVKDLTQVMSDGVIIDADAVEQLPIDGAPTAPLQLPPEPSDDAPVTES